MNEKDPNAMPAKPSAWRSLDALAATLYMPKPFLKRLADNGHIPFLQVTTSRRCFNLYDVNEALSAYAKLALKSKV